LFSLKTGFTLLLPYKIKGLYGLTFDPASGKKHKCSYFYERDE